jgi:amino acid adenylation domain-containing protein
VDGQADESAAEPAGHTDELEEAERRKLLVEWNRTELAFPQHLCLHQLFERQAEATPQAPALVYAGQSLSYAELNARANRLAHVLRGRGIGPEIRVALCFERSFDMLIALLAVLKAGGAYVPLDPSYPAERLRYMLSDSAPAVVLTHDAAKDRLEPGVHGDTALVMNLDRPWEPQAHHATENPAPEAVGLTPRQLAYVIYTSGSTGRPKGVMIEHRGLCSLAVSLGAQLGIGPGSRILQFASLSFDVCIYEIGTALARGATLFLAPEQVLKSIAALQAFIAGHRISHATLPPALLATLDDDGSFRTVGTLVSTGEACPKPVASRWSAGREFINAYGPTETTVYATMFSYAPDAGSSVPIGRPIANTRLYVLDERMRPVRTGATGELHVGGTGVARGYLNRPDLTAERFIDSPFVAGDRLYKTGDRVRYLPDGNVEYLGRMDHQVKIRGFRIEPGEIEAVLASHPGVRQAVVVAQADRAGGRQLIGYVVPHPGVRVEPRVLRSHAAQFLPEYMVPLAVLPLDALPLTPNGKLDRAALPAAAMAPTSSRLPASVHESMLAGLFAELLGFDTVGVEDNFFDLGGHSILAARLLYEVARRTGVTLPLRILFDMPSVLELAGFIDKAKADPQHQEHLSAATPHAVLIQAGSRRPPVFFVHALDGGVSQYPQLAAGLGDDVTVYGFAANQLGTGQYLPDTVEAIAGAYIEQMQRIQPEGPYHLAGWSSGGVIAFAMANTLLARGEHVGALGILDTKHDFRSPLVSLPKVALAQNLSAAQNHRNAEWCTFLGIFLAPWESNDIRDDDHPFWQPFWSMSDAEKVEHVIAYARDKGKIPATLSANDLHYLFTNMCRQIKALSLYAPPVYAGTMDVFLTSESLAREGVLEQWRKRCTGELHIVPINGNHVAVVEQPGAGLVAGAIRRRWEDGSA